MSNEYLIHHGIKGMHWGVRRYQNYDGTLKHPKGRKTLNSKNTSSESSEEPKKKQKKKGLTDKQKKALIIGAAAVATGLAIYGGYKLYHAYNGTGRPVDPETGFYKLTDGISDSENLRAINPGRIKFLSRKKNVEIINGSSQNCMLCTTAYELRKRGYDVRAGYSKIGFTSDDFFSQIYENYQGTEKVNFISNNINDITSSGKMSQLLKAFDKQPKGSRGNIMVYWRGPFGLPAGGHSMIWEKDKSGNMIFKDGQTGEVYKNFGEDILSRVTTQFKPIEILRTDNLKFNNANLKKFINSDTLAKTYVDHGAEIALKFSTNPTVLTTAGASVVGYNIAKDYYNEVKKEKIRESKKNRKS